MTPGWSKLPGWATTLVGLAIIAQVALSTKAMGDYVPGGPTLGDNAAPGLRFLLHGDLAGYAAHQPAIGLTSMLLRLPFAAAAGAFGGGELVSYRVGALACLIPLAFLAGWLAARQGGRGRLAGVTAGLLLVLSPVLSDAVSIGHPESVLTAVLATSAVLAAVAGRSRWAAVLLGLAVGSKPWGLIAVVPVLIALPGRRLSVGMIAGGIAAILTLAMPLADPGGFASALHGEGQTNLVNPLSLWWPVSSSFHLSGGPIAAARLLPFGLSRAQSSIVLLVLIAPPVLAALASALQRGLSIDPLALLVLLALIRCACDSTHLDYYYLALLVPLAAWEAVSLRRPPTLAALATAGVALIPAADALHHPTMLWAVSLGFTLFLGTYLASHALGRGTIVARRQVALVSAA
jgi:hypothetical protein